jgi:hypothetical protein
VKIALIPLFAFTIVISLSAVNNHLILAKSDSKSPIIVQIPRPSGSESSNIAIVVAIIGSVSSITAAFIQRQRREPLITSSIQQSIPYTTYKSPYKSTGIAVLLAILPCLGHIYTRRWKRGLAISILFYLFLIVLLPYGSPFFIPLLILWIWQIVDAGMSAKDGTSRKITIAAVVFVVITTMAAAVFMGSTMSE